MIVTLPDNVFDVVAGFVSQQIVVSMVATGRG
jgi:hypothetical protein